MSIIIGIFLILFLLKNTNFRAYLLLLTFLITSILSPIIFQNDAYFLTTCHSTNSQKSIISFGYVDFQEKVFLILYPTLENSIIRSNRKYFFERPNQILPNEVLIRTMLMIHCVFYMHNSFQLVQTYIFLGPVYQVPFKNFSATSR